MSIFEWLKAGAGTGAAPGAAAPPFLEDVVERLRNLPADRARWTAAFAMVLARGARADLEISPEELAAIADIVRRHAGIVPEQAALVAEMAAHRNQLLGASEEYLATREFRALAGDGDAEKLLDCLFAVAAADDTISLVEEEELRQIANELGVEHREFTAIRSRYRKQREVLRGLAGESLSGDESGDP